MTDADPAPRGDDEAATCPGLTAFGCDRDEADLFRALGPAFGVSTTATSEALSATDIAWTAGKRCVSVDHRSRVSRRELRALRAAGVEHLSTRSVGLDHIDVDAALDLGISVDNVPYAPDAVADHTILLLLMAVRRPVDVLRAADRHDLTVPLPRGRDLCDLAVGVVGTGRIGTAVIERLHGFGCTVLATNDRGRPVAGARLLPLHDLLAGSDVVTLHVPLTPTTRHLIGRRELRAMRPGALLVNTARGALVDTGALVEALEDGRLGGAALDVVEGEDEMFDAARSGRPVGDPRLRRLRQQPHALVTPHVAYRTERVLRETVASTLASCLAFERRRADDETEGRRAVRGHVGGA